MTMAKFSHLTDYPWSEMPESARTQAFDFCLPIVPKDWRPAVARTNVNTVSMAGLNRKPAGTRSRHYAQLVALSEGNVFNFKCFDPGPLPWPEELSAKYGAPIHTPVTLLPESCRVKEEVYDKDWKSIEIEIEAFDMFEENLPYLLKYASLAGHPHQKDATAYLKERFC